MSKQNSYIIYLTVVRVHHDQDSLFLLSTLGAFIMV